MLILDPEKLTKQQLLDSIEPLLASMKNQIDLLFNEDAHLIKKTTPTYNELFNRSQLIHEHLNYRRLHELNSEDHLLLDDFRSTLHKFDVLIKDYVNESHPYIKRKLEQNIQSIFNSLQKIITQLKPNFQKTLTDDLSAKPGSKDEDEKVPTLETFIGQYLKHVKTNFADKTHENASRVLQLFLKYLGNKPLNEIGPRDIEAFKEVRKKDVKPTTVNIDVRTLKAAFEVAANWEIIGNNPFSKVKQIRVEKREPRYLRKKDLDEICSRIKNPQIRDIVIFAAATGLRRGELLNLKWEDINWEDNSIRIQSGDVYKVKHGKLRYVPLNGLAIEILQRQKQKTSYVFPNRKGRALDADFVSRKFKDAVVSSNVSNDFRFHDLRSTFASWAISSGIPITALREILGHGSIITTQGYSKFDSDRLHREMKKFRIGDQPSKVDVDDLREILDSGS